MQSPYIDDVDFAKNIRQLLALAFVPSRDILQRFVELCKTDFWSENDDPDSGKVQQLLSYFEATYIGVEGRNRKRKAVQFPPEMWSVHEITILGSIIINDLEIGEIILFYYATGLPRTNNSLDAWHGVLGRTIGASHSMIFKFLMSDGAEVPGAAYVEDRQWAFSRRCASHLS